MKNIILCLLVQILLVNCDWKAILPPSTRGNLIDATSRCIALEYCEVVLSWANGDIIAVDMMNQDIYSYHNSINPIGFNQNITAVAYSSDASSIYVSVSNGSIYSQTLSLAGSSGNSWSGFVVPGLTTGASDIIPVNTQESSDLIIVTNNGTIIQADPSYSLSTVIKTSSSNTIIANTSVIVDLFTPDGTYLNGVWTAYTGGVITYTSLIDNFWTNFTVPQMNFPATQILTYRNNGTVWIIVGFSSGTATNSSGYLGIWDMASFQLVDGWVCNPITMTIIPDLELNDWLVYAEGTGIISKVNLVDFTIPDTTPAPTQISKPNLLHNTSQIVSLQTSWTTVDTSDDEGPQTVPVLIAVSKLGAVSALVAGTSAWQYLVDPAVLNDPNAKISYSTLVLSSFSSFTSPAYNVLIVLNDGQVLIQNNISSPFSIGSYSQASSVFIKKQDDYEGGLTSRRIAGGESIQVGTISFIEMCSLINMNAEIYIQLHSPSTGDMVEFRVVGYQVESSPTRSDTQNVVLLPMTNSTAMLGEVGFSFWTPEEISQGFDTLLDYIDVGLKIVDFVWTVTSLFL